MVPCTRDLGLTPSSWCYFHVILQGLFVYWCTNNCISLVQTGVLKNENVRKTLDIPKPPAPENTPNLQIKNPFAAVQEVS
jgi:membrane protein insertase Oxa1/YidC/SpoIIIJ